MKRVPLKNPIYYYEQYGDPNKLTKIITRNINLKCLRLIASTKMMIMYNYDHK